MANSITSYSILPPYYVETLHPEFRLENNEGYIQALIRKISEIFQKIHSLADCVSQICKTVELLSTRVTLLGEKQANEIDDLRRFVNAINVSMRHRFKEILNSKEAINKLKELYDEISAIMSAKHVQEVEREEIKKHPALKRYSEIIDQTLIGLLIATYALDSHMIEGACQSTIAKRMEDFNIIGSKLPFIGLISDIVTAIAKRIDSNAQEMHRKILLEFFPNYNESLTMIEILGRVLTLHQRDKLLQLSFSSEDTKSIDEKAKKDVEKIIESITKGELNQNYNSEDVIKHFKNLIIK